MTRNIPVPLIAVVKYRPIFPDASSRLIAAKSAIIDMATVASRKSSAPRRDLVTVVRRVVNVGAYAEASRSYQAAAALSYEW